MESKMERKPILLVDFDGVIHSYTSGWKGADVIPDPPVDGAIVFLKEAMEKFDVQIYSSRSKDACALVEMKTWLACNGCYFVKELKFPTQKPPAFLTIDDRAIQFNGAFPGIDELLAFKPWNKKEG